MAAQTFWSIGKRTMLAGDIRLTNSAGVYKDPVVGKVWYVDATNGSDSLGGKNWGGAFLTMSKAFTSAASGDRIYFTGKVREQLTTPAQVFDVRVIGVGTRPRHADSTPAGGETATATWTTPASGATTAALCKILQQGWAFENILFAGPTDHACVWLHRDSASGNSERDASHASFINCRFASGYNGIYDPTGAFNVLVENNVFQTMTNFCIVGQGDVGVGQSQWHIRNNHFTDFTNGIRISGVGCVIEGNFFEDGGTPNTTVVLNTDYLAGGSRNFVVKNYFQTTTANFNSPDIVGSATDVWAVNASIDSTAAGVGGNFEWGQPA